MEKKSLKVEVWSDLLCPFCYIGKRRLEGALARFAHAGEVEVEWRAFELDPRAPAAYPGTVNDLLVRKYGMSPARAQAEPETEARDVDLDAPLALDLWH